MHNLYIGDAEEDDLLSWLIENIAPVDYTSKNEWAFYSTYTGKDQLWVLDTSDVSDVSGQFDTVSHVMFRRREDLIMTKLRWGGSSL